MSKTLSWIFGIFFLGLAALRAFGEADLVLGLFAVDRALGVMHLTTGVIGILVAMSGVYVARLYLWTVGLWYLALAVAGFIAGQVVDITLNPADNFLNLAISAVALYVVFGEDPSLGDSRIPITGRRGVTDFREPEPRY